MTNTILIKRDELQQQIDLKNYYLGDAAKRKDVDADTLQSSNDEKELFVMFITRALNELVTAVALRFSSITYTIEDEYIELTFETAGEGRPHLLPLLKQAITDYLVNETLMPYMIMRQSLESNVQHLFAKFYNSTPVRRRSTNLAGI